MNSLRQGRLSVQPSMQFDSDLLLRAQQEGRIAAKLVEQNPGLPRSEALDQAAYLIDLAETNQTLRPRFS